MPHNAVKFWMVWNPAARGPAFKHDTRKSADDEAKRLAKANPRQSFFVLKAMGGFMATPVLTVPDEPEPIEMVEDDIPF